MEILFDEMEMDDFFDYFEMKLEEIEIRNNYFQVDKFPDTKELYYIAEVIVLHVNLPGMVEQWQGEEETYDEIFDKGYMQAV